MGEEVTTGEHHSQRDPGNQSAVAQRRIEQPDVSGVNDVKTAVNQVIEFSVFLFNLEKTRTQHRCQGQGNKQG